jgi:hypothetical protein
MRRPLNHHMLPPCCLFPYAANLTLIFSYPVELAQLAKSLKVAGSGAGGRTLTVSLCPAATVSPVPLPIIFTANGVNQGANNSPVDLLKLNSTCAVVRIVPGLEPGAAAVLRLPKGARYSPLAGPVAADTDVNVSVELRRAAVGRSLVCARQSFDLACTH